MFRRSTTRFIEPEEALSAFLQAHGLSAVSDKKVIERALYLASHPPGPSEKTNPYVPVLRMLIHLGFSREDLLGALYMARPVQNGTNPYQDQWIESDGAYRRDWDRVDVVEKASRLCTQLGLTFRGEEHWAPRIGPEWEDGIAVSPTVLGRHFNVSDPFGRGYHRLLGHLVEALRQAMLSLGSECWASAIEAFPFERLEPHPLAAEAFRFLDNDSYGLFITYPAQFGLRWRGSSMERAAWHMEHSTTRIGFVLREFPLNAYMVLCELIADPERIIRDGVLAIDCPGDVITETRGGHYRAGPCMVFQNERLHVTARSRASADAGCGSASGLIPFVR